jgi:hypothetical protein
MFYDVVDGIKFIEFELKDTKDTPKSASYLDIHQFDAIDNIIKHIYWYELSI